MADGKKKVGRPKKQSDDSAVTCVSGACGAESYAAKKARVLEEIREAPDLSTERIERRDDSELFREAGNVSTAPYAIGDVELISIQRRLPDDKQIRKLIGIYQYHRNMDRNTRNLNARAFETLRGTHRNISESHSFADACVIACQNTRELRDDAYRYADERRSLTARLEALTAELGKVRVDLQCEYDRAQASENFQNAMSFELHRTRERETANAARAHALAITVWLQNIAVLVIAVCWAKLALHL